MLSPLGDLDRRCLHVVFAYSGWGGYWAHIGKGIRVHERTPRNTDEPHERDLSHATTNAANSSQMNREPEAMLLTPLWRPQQSDREARCHAHLCRRPDAYLYFLHSAGISNSTHCQCWCPPGSVFAFGVSPSLDAWCSFCLWRPSPLRSPVAQWKRTRLRILGLRVRVPSGLFFFFCRLFLALRSFL